MFRANTLVFINVFCVLFYAFGAHAAEKKEGVLLTSPVDAALTIHKVTLVPTIDNVDGIFSRPIDKRLQELLEKDHQWDFVPSQFAGGFASPVDFIKSPDKAIKIGAPLKVDAFVMAEVRKNPKDFVIAFHLFSTKDGKLISHVATKDLDQSSMDKAMLQVDELYKQLKYRVPYDGLILSRTKNRVTMNLGQVDGLTQGQELSVSKIIAVTRHPKLGYVIQNEKSLIGKAKVIKVDKNLAFADITSEIESGAIQKDSKITGARVLTYSPEQWIAKDYLPPELLLSENNQVNGKIQEWKPEMPPTFGQVGASFGLGRYKNTLSLDTPVSYESKSSMYPTITLFGEMWINPEWYVHASLSQGTGDLTNPVPGGSPGDVSTNMGQYSLDVGYNLLLRDDFFDSKLFFALGFYSFKVSVDHSTPAGLMSSEYSSLRLTIGGKTPIDDLNHWYLGGALYWYVNPQMKEKPQQWGGDSDAKVVHFKFMVDYRWSERLWINSSLDFTTLMADYAGPGNVPGGVNGVKTSQRLQTLNIGASYMF